MPLGHRVVFSAREKPIVEAAIRGLLAGRYKSLRGAARACFAQLTQLRQRHPDAQSPHASGTLSSTCYYIGNQVRGKWRHTCRTAWTEAESRVLKQHVHDLLHGRYLSAVEAAEACTRRFERLRTPNGNAGRPQAPRTRGAVRSKITRLAREAGRSPWRVRYTRAEMDAFDRYARLMAGGRYPNLTPAVVLCREDLAQLRARGGESAPPPRPFETVRRQICCRARSLGWTWSTNAKDGKEERRKG